MRASMLPSLTWWPSRMLHHMLSSMDLHQLSARARMILPSSPSLRCPQHWHPHPLRPMIQMRLMSFMSFSCVCVSVLFRLFMQYYVLFIVFTLILCSLCHITCVLRPLATSSSMTFQWHVRADGLIPMAWLRWHGSMAACGDGMHVVLHVVATSIRICHRHCVCMCLVATSTEFNFIWSRFPNNVVHWPSSQSNVSFFCMSHETIRCLVRTPSV